MKKRAKDLNRNLIREDIQMAGKPMTNSSTSYIIRKGQITVRYHHTPIWTAKIENTDNTRYQGISHSLLVGVQDGVAALEDSLAMSYKIKHTLTMQFSNCTPWHLPEGVENTTALKHAHGYLQQLYS